MLTTIKKCNKYVQLIGISLSIEPMINGASVSGFADITSTYSFARNDENKPAVNVLIVNANKTNHAR